MANVTDFMASIYDMLAKQFAAADGTFLQLGWPGISLSAADFKPAANPNGPYDPATAEEMVSVLANIAPACHALRFENSGFELDDLYQIVIAGAVPLGSDPNNLLNSPQYKLFSDAQYEFLAAQRGSVRDPNTFFYPVRATPSDWYTEDAARSWPTLSIASSQVKAATASSPFVRLGGQQLVNAGVLKLAPPETKTVVQNRLRANVDQRVQKFETRVPASQFTQAKPLERARVDAFNANVATRSATRALGAAAPKRIDTATVNPQTFDMRTAQTFDVRTAQPVINAAATRSAKEHLRPSFVVGRGTAIPLDIDTARFDVAAPALPPRQRIYLRQLLNEQMLAVPVAPATAGFSISFKYCLVTLDRSWMKSALLRTPNWYMFATKAGEYSQGRIDNNPGMFPMLPAAFIAIRDLRISANWTQQDAQAVAQTKTFGPFDVRSGTFNQSTLEAKQLQIIGWLSRLTPVLPPQKDPALP